jgi:hypothetical protein
LAVAFCKELQELNPVKRPVPLKSGAGGTPTTGIGTKIGATVTRSRDSELSPKGLYRRSDFP